MGARLNWLAVENAEKAMLLAQLGYVEAGLTSEETDSSLVYAELPGGWHIIVSASMDLDLDKALRGGSAGGLALGGEVEEHVMFSRLRAFRAGAAIWSVTHDPDVDRRGVTLEGEPPPPFAELRRELAAEQEQDEDDEVDYMFDLPPRLGQRLCGYTHDELIPVVWTILERANRKLAPEPPARLPEAFRSKILPQLTASGWTLAAQDPAFRGRPWDVTRIVDGHLEELTFHFRESGQDLQFDTGFMVFDGPAMTDKVLRAGQTRAVRPASGSLLKRIADRFRTGPTESSAPTDPLDNLISRVKEDLAAIEAFLSTGERNPRLQINRDDA